MTDTATEAAAQRAARHILESVDINTSNGWSDDELKAAAAIIAAEFAPFVARAEAGALAKECLEWVARPGLKTKGSVTHCYFCGCQFPNEAEAHEPDCLHIRAWRYFVSSQEAG